MLSVDVPQEIERQLALLCQTKNQSVDLLVTLALERFLEDEYDLEDAIKSHKDFVASGQKGYTLVEMKKRYDLD